MNEHISEKLRKLRSLKGLQQRQIAKMVGIHASTLSAYENASRLPSYHVLVKLANIYGVTVDYLLDHDKPSPDILTNLSGPRREMISQIADIIFQYLDKEESMK